MQVKKTDLDPTVERLRHYQVSRGLTWQQMANKIGVSRGMLMMVLRGDRRLSTKALFKLEEMERGTADRRTAAERFVEGLIGDRGLVSQLTGQSGKHKKEIAVQYQAGKSNKSLPPCIALRRPAEDDCQKLRSLFAQTLDTRIIALACLHGHLRSEGFLDQLTAESRTRLTTEALDLVIPDWRVLVTQAM